MVMPIVRHSALSRRQFLWALAAGTAGTLVPGLFPSAAVADSSAKVDDEELRRFVRKLPKAELHLHIEGVTDPELAFVLAERNGVSLPFQSPEAFASTLKFDSLESFLAGYERMISVLKTGEDFYDVTLQYLRKAEAAGIVYAEMHFDPQAHTSRGIAFEAVLDGITSAQRDGQTQFGVRSRLIMAFQRNLDLSSARDVFEKARQNRNAIVGLGLDNYELPGFPDKFTELYRAGAAEGFQLTSHCDLDVPGSIDHVRGCIEQLGVSRLDHGYSVFEDPALVEVCRQQRIAFTACPTTDWSLPNVTEDYYAAAVNESVRRMLELGLRVGLNTDDPGLMGGRYLDDVFFDTGQALQLTRGELVQLSRNAFESIWAPDAEKREYLRQLVAFEHASAEI